MTRATDEEIFKRIIQHEGTKYTNRPNDLGGPTKFGITIPAWETFSRKKATAETIKNLTLDDARAYYLAMHIRPLYMLEDPLRLFLIDLSVLRGMRSAVMMLQGAILGVTADGWIGNETLGAIKNFKTDANVLMLLLAGARLQHITERLRDNPSQKENVKGWRNRTLEYVQNEA